MKIKVLTDSVSDLTPQDVAKYQIGLIPLTVNFGNESYLDKDELTIEQFYHKLAESKVNPTTSQPSPGSFITAFEDALAENDLVIYIGVSEKLSGTFSGAQFAANQVQNDRLILFNSGNVTFAQGMIVLALCRKLPDIKSRKELIGYLNYLRQQLRSYYIVDTLEYLIRGGRVNWAQGTLGNLLGIKPIITIRDGDLKVVGKARSFHRAMVHVIKLMKKDVPSMKLGGIGLFHAVAPDRLESFRKLLVKQFTIGPVYHAYVGSVIGTHAGPGAIAIAFFKDCNI